MPQPSHLQTKGILPSNMLIEWHITRCMTFTKHRIRRHFARYLLASLLAGLILVPDHGSAQTFTGQVTVIDGDTLKMGRKRIRLFGVDAPESKQTCQTAAGKDWWCGTEASRAMRTLAHGKTASCHQQDIDRYGRIVAICEVGGRDIGEDLVEQGLAIAYRYFSRRYIPAEDRARQALRGMWSGRFQEPYEWRKGRR